MRVTRTSTRAHARMRFQESISPARTKMFVGCNDNGEELW